MAIDAYSNSFSYYSGSQITVWFGNIYIDDIYSIQWVRTQNKMPIYGYASRNFDSVANGTVLVQGNFTINFRQQGYMSYIMRAIKDIYLKIGQGSSINPAAKQAADNLIAQHLKNGTFGPQTADQIKAIGNDPNFVQLANDYANAVWGASADTSDSIYPADVEQTLDIPDGFDIKIAYGNLPNSDIQTQAQLMQSTYKTLDGVHIVGESQLIQVGGQPTQEQYSFIARDTDSTV